MDPYDQEQADLDAMAEAEAEFEFAQKQKAKVNSALDRGKPPPFANNNAQLGPDYSQSIPDNFYKGVGDIPDNVADAGSSIYNFIQPFDEYAIGNERSGPINTIQRAGAEKTARTVGTMAGATAGGAYLGGLGAAYGTAILPGWGTAAGGIGGGLVGAGLGALGFNMVTDAATGETKQPEQYAKDFVYGLPLDTLLGGPFMAAPVKGAVERGARTKVLRTLDEQAPGWLPAVNKELPEVGPLENPLSAGKSTAEIANAPRLKVTERGLPLADPNLYPEIKRLQDERNTEQLRDLKRITDPSITVGDTQSRISDYVAGDLAARQAAIDAAGDVVRMRVEELPLTQEAIEGGVAARNVIEAGFDTQHGKVSEAFTGAGDAPVPRDPIIAATKAAKDAYFREVGTQPSGELASLIAKLTGESAIDAQPGVAKIRAPRKPGEKPPTFTLKDAQALRSEAIRIAKKPTNRQSGAVASQIIGAIDEAFKQAEISGALPPEQLASLREGIALRKEQGDIFEGAKNPNAAILKSNYSGSPLVPDSAVPGKIFAPSAPGRPSGTRENVLRYKEAAKASGLDYATAMDPIYRHAANSFRKMAVNEDGTVNTTRAKEWFRKYDEALKEIPEIRQQFENPTTAQAFLDEKFGDLKRTKDEVRKSALQFWIGEDVNPKVAIANMLSGKGAGKKVRETVKFLQRKGDKDALAGLGSGIVDHLIDLIYEPNKDVSIKEAALPDGPTFDGRVRDALLETEWRDIKAAVEGTGLYTESQMKVFDRVYKDKASQLSVKNATMTGGSPTIQNSVINGLLNVSSQSFLSGKPSLIRFGATVFGKMIRQVPQAVFLKMLAKAALDPRFARDLHNAATGKNLVRAADLLFKDEIAKALGRDATLGQNAVKAAKVAPFALTQESYQEQEPVAAPVPRKPLFPRAATVTSTKSFPTPAELLKPPAPGELKNSTFTLPARDAYDSAGKKKVNFLGEDMDKESLQKLISQQSPETQARIATESAGNPFAVSPKGAQGLAQLMPSTAMEIAKQLGEEYLPLRADMSLEQQQKSIEQNIRFGDYYYKKQLKRFNDPKLAWAAYNAGPQRVANAITKAGSRKWDTVARYLPQETRDYVPRILNAKQKVEMA